MSFYTILELNNLGFKTVGSNVKISRKASLYNIEKISIGSNVRIDDFCVIAAGVGGINIESFVHIAVGCTILGSENITLCEFSGLSSRVSIYSSSDDYSGMSLTNPTVPDEYKNVKNAKVWIGKHVIVGSGSVVMPGVTLHDGSAIGALSFVSKSCDAFSIYAGSPLKKIRNRDVRLLQLEEKFKKDC